MVRDGVLVRAGPERRVARKATTTWRYRRRLVASARALTQILQEAGVDLGEALGGRVLLASRAELVESLAAAGRVSRTDKLGGLAAWIHRLVPGVRLM
jgi:hypothetical protein